MLRTLGATAACGALGLALLVSSAYAQPARPAGPPPAPPAASKDPAAAPAGAYKLDPGHTSLIARLGHMNGFSYSTFRFGTVSGTLNWNPAAPENSKVDITVDPKSIMTPVQGFAEELGGDRFLNVGKYPDAHFVSTSIQRTGPTTGVITGNLTLMGQTRPITIKAEMVGAGRGMRGTVIGFTGIAHFKRSDFGFSAMIPIIADDVELLIDTEFDAQG